jgi:hypothetical protein
VCWLAILVFRRGCFRDVSCIATSGVGCVVCCYLVLVACNASNIGLYVCRCLYCSFEGYFC